eukprot:11203308-Lingulodinium_polyedra.AAC.1
MPALEAGVASGVRGGVRGAILRSVRPVCCRALPNGICAQAARSTILKHGWPPAANDEVAGLLRRRASPLA